MENQVKLNPQITAIKEAYLHDRNVTDIEIALASYSILNDYRWLPYPTPPEEVKKFYNRAEDLKTKMRRNPESYLEFWREPSVMQYFDAREFVKTQNMTRLEWLQWMKKTLEESHPDKITAIDLKIYQFSGDYRNTLSQPKWSSTKE